ncbi:hypothetical protein Mapa_006311 [Marchantia paleacea]|nr:hypothetical protein Mapa_006311 [Marchantia paleacea]
MTVTKGVANNGGLPKQVGMCTWNNHFGEKTMFPNFEKIQFLDTSYLSKQQRTLTASSYGHGGASSYSVF